MHRVLPKILTVSFVVIASGVSSVSFGAAPASDNASASAYGSGFTNGLNGGSGFQAWQISNTSGSSSLDGEFIGDSSLNGSGTSGNINTTGASSWGLYANTGNTANAVRPFSAGGSNGSNVLGVGETFSIAMDNGFEDNGSVEGFSLQNSSGTNRLEFYFTGGQSNYDINVNGVEESTSLTGNGIPFTADGLSLTYTQLAASAWTLAVTPSGGSTQTYSSTNYGAVAASDVSQVRVFNFGATANGGNSRNAYFNSVQVVPEPASLGLLGLSAAGFAFVQRRRASRR